MSLSAAVDAESLTDREAEVLSIVTRYYEVTQEGCPSRLLARRLGLHHETIRRYYAELNRKGWLRTDSSPAIPAKPFLARRSD